MGALHPAFTTTSHVLELTSCQIGLLPLQRVTRHERHLLLSAITYAACGCVHGALKFWWLNTRARDGACRGLQHRPSTHTRPTAPDSTAMPIHRQELKTVPRSV